uniref:ATP synthase F0 subunit 8 n=1 Tax=Panagrolaimus sp. JU765 TaxID=591449 RepID=A0AC34R098_9BILA
MRIWFNIYIVALTVYWLIRSQLILKLYKSYVKKDENKPKIIKDTFGRQIKISQTMAEHMQALHAAWN